MSLRVIFAEDGTPRGIKEAEGNSTPEGWTIQTVYTAADLLRVAEAVREECASAFWPPNLPDVSRFDARDAVRAVDVAEVVRRVTGGTP